MKFKFNYPEKKLWRIKDDYLYEVSEENRSIDSSLDGKVSFQLGENHWITFNPRDGWNYRITIGYTKPLKNGETAYYEKEIKRELYGSVVTIFEFTEADQKSPTKN